MPDDLSAHGMRKGVPNIVAEKGCTSEGLKGLGGWLASKHIDLYTARAASASRAQRSRWISLRVESFGQKRAMSNAISEMEAGSGVKCHN